MSQSSRITPEHRNIFTGLHRGLNRNNGTYALRVACSNSVVTVTTPVVSATRKQLKAATATHPPRSVRPALGRARHVAGPSHALHVRHVRPRTPKPSSRAVTRDCDKMAQERTKTSQARSVRAAANNAINQRQPRRAGGRRGLASSRPRAQRRRPKEKANTGK